MLLPRCLRNLPFTGHRRTGRPGPAVRFRPQLEALEARWVPSQVNLTVTSLADDSSTGTLREAIKTADMGSPSDKFTIGFSVTGTINLQNPLPDLTNSIAIQGPGESSLTVEPAATFTAAIFTVDAGQTASISGLTIAKGDAGGIANEGTLTVANSTIMKCSALTGGGIDNLRGGTLTVSGCTLSGNSAISSGLEGGVGGGIFNNGGTLTVSDCTLSGDSAGAGGGIYSQGTATVTGSTLCGNSGGGIDDGGTLTVSDCTLSGNTGGGIVNNFATVAVTGSKFTGNTAAPGAGGGGILSFQGDLTVADSTFCGNSAPDQTFSNGVEVGGGGAIKSIGGTATVTNCTLSNNSASFGGGIYSDGTLVVSGSTLCGNSAVDSGGGIYIGTGTATLLQCTLSGNSAGSTGGGISNPAARDMVTVKDSTLSGNSALSGGGIWNGTSATLDVRDSTFSGNTASDSGGGMFNEGTATVQNCTLTGNSAANAGGGIFNAASGTLKINDSAVLSNSALSGADLYNLGALTLNDSTIG